MAVVGGAKFFLAFGASSRCILRPCVPFILYFVVAQLDANCLHSMLSCQTPTEDEAYLEDDDDYVRAPIPQKMEQLVDDMVIVNPKRIPSIASTKVR